MRNIKSLVVGLVVAVSGFAAVNLVTTANAGDCSANSVVRCGVGSYSELRSKYNGNASVRNIFSHFGISSSLVNGGAASVPTGYVTKSGDVYANGKKVATGATTAGRQYIPGSTKRSVGGTTFYERAPSVSFRSSSLSAYVYLDKDGKFLGAVIKDCGNPVKGRNVVVPPKPVVKKVEVCDLTTFKKVTITEDAYNKNKTRYTTDFSKCEVEKVCDLSTFKIVTIYKGQFDSKKHSRNLEDCAKVKVCDTTTGKIVEVAKDQAKDDKYSTDLSDCEKMEVCELETGKTITINKNEYNETLHSTDLSKCDVIKVCVPETKEIKTIRQSEFDETKHSMNMADCEETPVVPETPETPVEVPPAPVEELPQTGMSEFLSGGLGLGALTAASYYYVASRRQ